MRNAGHSPNEKKFLSGNSHSIHAGGAFSRSSSISIESMLTAALCAKVEDHCSLGVVTVVLGSSVSISKL